MTPGVLKAKTASYQRKLSPVGTGSGLADHRCRKATGPVATDSGRSCHASPQKELEAHKKDFTDLFVAHDTKVDTVATDVVKLSNLSKTLAEHQQSVSPALDAARHDLSHLQTDVNSLVTDLESAVALDTKAIEDTNVATKSFQD